MLHCIEWVMVNWTRAIEQRLNGGKSPGTGRCEWLWTIALCL